MTLLLVNSTLSPNTSKCHAFVARSDERYCHMRRQYTQVMLPNDFLTHFNKTVEIQIGQKNYEYLLHASVFNALSLKSEFFFGGDFDVLIPWFTNLSAKQSNITASLTG